MRSVKEAMLVLANRDIMKSEITVLKCIPSDDSTEDYSGLTAL